MSDKASDHAAPKNQNVLLIEGDPIVRDLITMALERNGFSVAVTCDTVEALQHFRKEDVCLVLLDLLSPQTTTSFPINGLDLIGQFQKEGLLEKAPVIVISALGYREIVEQAIQAGAIDFLVKPIHTEMLIAHIQAILKRARGLSDQSKKALGFS